MVALRVIVGNDDQGRGVGFTVDGVLEGVARGSGCDGKALAIFDGAAVQGHGYAQRADREESG